MTTRLKRHICGETLQQQWDGEAGLWRFVDLAGYRLQDCPRCGKRITTKKTRIVAELVEEGRR